MATKEAILSGLNPEQRQAVIDYDGSMVVEAGPGSGKTHTIVSRCQYMILDGVKPGSILVFTFTRKAANELRERIQDAVGEHAAKEMTICTYHSFCGKLLRHFAEYVGRNRNFTIYDEEDKRGILEPICKKYHNYKYETARDYISRFKEECITSSQAEKETYTDTFKSVAARIYKEYDKAMNRCNAFDFDDLTFRAYLLLKNCKAALDFVHKKYKYIIADENQDSSKQNLEFSLMLRGESGNLCYTGDLDQSIYAFRGARPDKVLETISGKEFKKVYLKTNYRSTQTIVNASSKVIKHNLMRADKKLDTINEFGSKIHLIHAKSDTEESMDLACRIRNLHEVYDIPYNDIAILCRVQRSTRALEEALLSKKVPYRLKGMAPFYSRREIKDIISFLRLLENPQDEEAYRRIVNIPKHNVGKVSVEKILTKARQSDDICDIISVYKGMSLAYKTKIGLEEFENNFNAIRAYAETCNDLGDLIRFIIKTIDYESFLESEYDASFIVEERMWNLEELAAISSQFASIEDLMQNFVIDPDQQTQEGLAEDSEVDAINIMTMHSSKGLEFRVVFLYEVNEGVIPHALSQSTPQEIEEERRLFYVAMTRAKKELYISYSDERKQSSYKVIHSKPSRFISEIPSVYIEETTVIQAS